MFEWPLRHEAIRQYAVCSERMKTVKTMKTDTVKTAKTDLKKSIIAMLGIVGIGVALLAGCGAKKAQPGPDGPVVDDISSTPSGEGQNMAGNMVGMANPWVEITEKEANEVCTRLFKAPEGANVQAWQKCESLGDPAKSLGPLVQLNFELDGLEFTARAQQGANEEDDISGIYVDWTVGPEDVTLANWGGGNMAGRTYRYIGDDGYTDLITWYDIEIGIKYSLSVSADDLDGFDIQAVAEQMYSAENK